MTDINFKDNKVQFRLERKCSSKETPTDITLTSLDTLIEKMSNLQIIEDNNEQNDEEVITRLYIEKN